MDGESSPVVVLVDEVHHWSLPRNYDFRPLKFGPDALYREGHERVHREFSADECDDSGWEA